METLIIPDIHIHVHNAAFWLREYPADRVIFLGDFFDDFGDTPADVCLRKLSNERHGA